MAHFPADPAAAGQVRRFVQTQMDVLDLGGLRDDAELLTSELVANVILHAHTEFEVRVCAISSGVRLEVDDGSSTLPSPGTLHDQAGSGRGLMLVQLLASRWGAERRGDGGKTVWFELSTRTEDRAREDIATPDPDLDVDAFLAQWTDDQPQEQPPGEPLVEVVIPDLSVRPLLQAKAHMEDLLRELQLTLISYQEGSSVAAVEPVIHLARRLDAAAKEFAEGRRQIRIQTLAAAARGEDVVTLRLRLPGSALGSVTRYRQAIAEAEQLGDAGDLLAPAREMEHHTAIRHAYLTRIIDQLDPAARHRRLEDPAV